MHVHGVLLGPDGKELFSQSNPGQVTLTGRKAIQKTLHNAIAITDTLAKDSAITEVADIPLRKILHVRNTLDQPVDISVFVYSRLGDTGTTYYGPSNINSGTTKTVAAGVNMILTETDSPALNHPVQFMMVRAKCSVAPTTGSVSVWLEGVPN